MINIQQMEEDLENVFREIDLDFFIDKVFHANGFYIYGDYKVYKKKAARDHNSLLQKNIFIIEYELNTPDGWMYSIIMRFFNPDNINTVFLDSVDVEGYQFNEH